MVDHGLTVKRTPNASESVDELNFAGEREKEQPRQG